MLCNCGPCVYCVMRQIDSERLDLLSGVVLETNCQNRRKLNQRLFVLYDFNEFFVHYSSLIQFLLSFRNYRIIIAKDNAQNNAE